MLRLYVSFVSLAWLLLIVIMSDLGGNIKSSGSDAEQYMCPAGGGYLSIDCIEGESGCTPINRLFMPCLL